jgi:hypothetical protein
MQKMVNIPATMPAGADETNSKRHSRHTSVMELELYSSSNTWLTHTQLLRPD